tara:strand:+ start:793 stop:2361 length:1569 start_codon:yes stop_codon:yes gene_type:complete
MSDFIAKTCDFKKTSDPKFKCKGSADYNYKKFDQCFRHIKITLEKKSIDEVKKVDGVKYKGVLCVKDSNVEEKEVKKSSTKSVKASGSKASKKKTEKVSSKSKTSPSQPIEKPTAKENGTCSGKKGNGDDCDKTARHTCEDTCEICEGAAFCGTHWNSTHKSAKSSTSKFALDEQCEHTYASGAKKGEKCGSKSNGVGSDGLRACGRHGVKKDKAVTASVALGPLGDMEMGELMANVCNCLMLHTIHIKKCDICKDGEEYCADFVIASWLQTLNFIANVGEFDESDLIEHLANIEFASPSGEEHQEIFGESVFVSLISFMKQNHMWLFKLYEKYSKSEGENGAKIKALFDEIVSDFDFVVKKESKSKEESSSKANKILSTNKKRNAKSILENLNEELEEEESQKKSSEKKEKKPVKKEKESEIVDQEDEIVVEVDEDVVDNIVDQLDDEEGEVDLDDMIISQDDDDEEGEADLNDIIISQDDDEEGEADLDDDVIVDQDDDEEGEAEVIAQDEDAEVDLDDM